MSDDQLLAGRAPEGREPHQRPRPYIRTAIILWAVCTVIGELILIWVAQNITQWQGLPPSASDRADEINNVMFLFTALSIPVFFLVVAFGGYCVFAFGSRRVPREHGPAMLVNPRFQFIWIACSTVLVALLYVYGLTFLAQVDALAGPSALQVNVTAEQWLFDYSYPQYGYASSTTLEVPVNRPINFSITSLDVQHSFWVQAFAIKQDAVPGEVTHISVTPKQLGTFEVHCAELCGLNHAYMAAPVNVVSASDFATWVSQQPKNPPVQPSGRINPVPPGLAGAILAETRRSA